ncbi:hypothetical protein NV381_28170 [Paenibacillus sp. N5-1-1-5]|uniref:Uncharacterized protein n=1 Tax=Paenibacillus radicis (ex Xue et al. 2023) TaxID=2972489 RepID=A0ABT1YS07_9BACL|nr:hypothetical protein [Paenibacillus radicis (ex Xue et al. 2023)]
MDDQHKNFKDIHWDPTCYLWNEPGDWNRIKRIIAVGVLTARHPEPLTKHNKAGGNIHV